ncbi:hypothetical protein GCM10010510_68970 [Streptomyces anandii JCM 4720]|nr:hypothetical protein GCM10010510_68970 [Streptomyces anandii JCM 4720]
MQMALSTPATADRRRCTFRQPPATALRVGSDGRCVGRADAFDETVRDHRFLAPPRETK